MVWPITVMCSVLKVSRSGFYAWRKQKTAPPTPTRRKRETRLKTIERIFDENHRIYGYRKICASLQREGVDCSRNTVHADCKRLKIKSVTRKKFRVKTTDSRHDNPVAENVLNRQFTASKLNEKWVTDITYIETLEGFLYVCVILDLFSRRVIGWSMEDHMRTEMVIASLRMAIQNTRGRHADEILLHSDRGVQFTSEQFRDCLNLTGITQSMSNKGDCWDNASCESWFGKLKSEWIYPCRKIYATREEAKLDLFQYIEGFYNTRRLHQSLGYRTPLEVEQSALDERLEVK